MFTGANTKRGSSYLTVSSASRGRNSESSSEGRTAAALSVPDVTGTSGNEPSLSALRSEYCEKAQS